MAKELVIRKWRMESVPDGCWLFFDPSREDVRLYELEPRAETGVLEVSEGDDQIGIFDEVKSSNNEIVEDDLPF